MLKYAYLLGFTFLLIGGCARPQNSGEVLFFEGSWADAQQEARATGKYLYLDMYTDWCGPCKWMDKEVFTDSTLATFMNDRFVCFHADAEKGEGIQLAMKYRIRAYPTHLVFDSEGQLLHSFSGGMEAPIFQEQLERILNRDDQIPLAGISPQLELDYPAFFHEAREKRKRVPDSIMSAYLAEHEDWTDEAVWSVIFFCAWSDDVRTYINENRSMLEAHFGAECVADKLEDFNRIDLNRAIERKDEVLRDTAIARLVHVYPEGFRDVMAARLHSQYAVGTGNWGEMRRLLLEQLDDDDPTMRNSQLNSACWTLYLKCDDRAHLDWAVGVMEDVIAEEPTCMYVDTYAALLFKTGHYDEAEQQALRAIDIGVKAEEDVQSTRDLLAKIREKI